jgi:hypothetical protein
MDKRKSLHCITGIRGIAETISMCAMFGASQEIAKQLDS